MCRLTAGVVLHIRVGRIQIMEQIIKEFCDYTLMNTNLSMITVEGYYKYLHKVLAAIGKAKPSEDEIKRYMLELRTSGYSVSYINNISTALEKYMAWLGRDVRLPRLKRHHEVVIDTLTPGEIARMLAATKNSRQKAMLAILAYSGIRVKELCNLKVNDVKFDSASIHIGNGKGGVDRVAYISKEGLAIVAEYLKEYPRSGDDYLITTLAENRQYNGSAVRKTLDKLAAVAGIQKRVYPHLLRHSLATNLLSRGVGILTIQSILGHKHLQSTLIYAHSSPKRVAMEYNYYVPSYL